MGNSSPESARMPCPPEGLCTHGDNISCDVIITSLSTSALCYIPYTQCIQQTKCQERIGSGIWSVCTDFIVTIHMW